MIKKYQKNNKKNKNKLWRKNYKTTRRKQRNI